MCKEFPLAAILHEACLLQNKPLLINIFKVKAVRFILDCSNTARFTNKVRLIKFLLGNRRDKEMIVINNFSGFIVGFIID